MRVSTEELLSIRDGEPVDVTALRRLASDPEAQAELARLSACRDALRALPAYEPPPATWARIVETQQGAQRRPRRAGAVVLASLATITLAVLLADRGGSPAPQPDTGRTETLTLMDTAEMMESESGAVRAPWTGGRPDSVSASAAAPLWRVAVLAHESHELEQQLRALEPRPRLATARTVGTAVQLEDRLLLIDHRLSTAEDDGLSEADIADLWEQRVELMSSLLAVRREQERRHAF